MKLFVPLFLLLTFLAMISCQTIKDRFDLWFVVPKNPFNQPTRTK